ncbi:MAG: zinc ribbon domain-containing protein [Clostridia bacterium]|nr:zinc ribbon domain-containing protein [Clostridia bacterium]
MAFCINCGQELAEGAKFCANCGKAANDSNSTEQRKTTYDGEIHKCPNCGEILDSFVTACPACGYELRGSSATGAVKEFAAKLNNVTTEYQKENIIRSFPVPNTKEDIFEFMILASSNIDERPNKAVFDAWIAKFQQCYQKAKLSFKQESDFVKIQAIYEKTQKEIKKIRRKGPLRKTLIIVLPIVAFIVLNIAFWSWISSGYNNEEEEVARLEGIVAEVELALDNNEYDLAMMHAKSIDYSAWTSNDELERQWDIKRDYLIKKVISAASEDGIIMEYPTDTADEKDQEDKSNSYNYEKSKEEIQSNIDEFNKYMDEVEDMWNQYTKDETQE